MTTLADVLGNLHAGAFNLHLITRRGDDLERAQDGHAGADERRIGPAKTGERDFMNEVTKNRCPHEQLILGGPALGRGDIFSQAPINPVAKRDEVEKIRFQEITQFDEELGRRGELGAEVLKHIREDRDHKDEQHIDQCHREADDGDGVSHRGFNFLGEPDGRFEIAGDFA